jgi:hypothetical protein
MSCWCRVLKNVAIRPGCGAPRSASRDISSENGRAVSEHATMREGAAQQFFNLGGRPPIVYNYIC